MTIYETIISSKNLAEPLNQFAIVDCRFLLSDSEKGRRDYLQAHIPGAVYAHLEEDLSGEIIPGKTGRHPLPSIEMFAKKLSSWGIDNQSQVVMYDDNGGAIASRLWWMLRWVGHRAAALLDGGWQAWIASGYPTRSGEEHRQPRNFIAKEHSELLATIADVYSINGNQEKLLVDSRDKIRFLGENEPIDPVAGRIPWAVNSPHRETVDSKGYFLSREKLRAHFEAVLGDIPVENSVFYCGSGVTAARNLVALKIAGLGEGKLYAGSYSEWITDPSRPVAKG